MSRRRNEDDEVGGQFYTMVTHIPVQSFAGLLTEKNTGVAEDDEWSGWFRTLIDSGFIEYVAYDLYTCPCTMLYVYHQSTANY